MCADEAEQVTDAGTENEGQDMRLSVLHVPDQAGLCRLGWILSVSQSAKRRNTKCFTQGTEMTTFCCNTLVAEWEGEGAEDRKSTYFKYCFSNRLVSLKWGLERR